MTAVLVSGATGFIGRRLCTRLQDEGEDVLALVRHKAAGPWARVLVHTLGQASLPAGALSGVRAVFHLAGRAHAEDVGEEGTRAYNEVNVIGTRTLLEAAAMAGVERFVFVSSVKAMGEGGSADCVNEEMPPAPATPYGRSKLEAEHLVLEGGYVPHPVVLRPALVYGPCVKGNLNRMIEAIRAGTFPPLPGVRNLRSMVHVDDLVEAALCVASERQAAGEVFLVTDGQLYSTGDIYRGIRSALGLPPSSVGFPVFLLQMLATLGDGYQWLNKGRSPISTRSLAKLVESECYDSRKLNRVCGFRPRRSLWEVLPQMVGECSP